MKRIQWLEAGVESKLCQSESAKTEGFETFHGALKHQANQGSTSCSASCAIMGGPQTASKGHK